MRLQKKMLSTKRMLGNIVISLFLFLMWFDQKSILWDKQKKNGNQFYSENLIVLPFSVGIKGSFSLPRVQKNQVRNWRKYQLKQELNKLLREREREKSAVFDYRWRNVCLRSKSRRLFCKQDLWKLRHYVGYISLDCPRLEHFRQKKENWGKFYIGRIAIWADLRLSVGEIKGSYIIPCQLGWFFAPVP